MARSTPTILRIAGVPVRVHWTFSFVLLLLVPAGETASVPVGIRAALLCALTLSIIVHEAGHLVAARRLGLAVADVTLYPFGGITRTVHPPGRGRETAIVAAAGPLASLLLAAVLAAAAACAHAALAFGLRVVALGNLVLALGNLLPAHPLDGGRIARSLLEPRLGAERAARLTGRTGQLLGLGLIVAGLRTDPWWLLAGTVLLLGATAELGAASLEAAFRDPPVSRVMLPDPLVAPADAPETELRALARANPDREIVLVGPRGPVARIPAGSMADTRRIGDTPQRTEPLGPAIPGNLPVSEALALLRTTGTRAVVVVDSSGSPVGVVTFGMLQRVLRFGRRLSERMGRTPPGGDGAGRKEHAHRW